MNFESPAEFWENPAHDADWEQVPVLRSAVDKLIRFGEQVGVSRQEMVMLSDSGTTVRGLLYCLVSQSSPMN